MDPIKLSKLIEDRYRRYLKTTFYFRDPVLRTSFEKQLESGVLRKGPYLEATPVFKRKTIPAPLLKEILGTKIDEGFVRSLTKETPSLYVHQELAIRKVSDGRNVIVATGTGSGKTEAFLYPILIDLYREFQAGTSAQPGVRALILYPMNALANDQRERLGELCKLLRENNSPFRFTFGQYIGETPDDGRDRRRHANDHLAYRKEKGFSIIQNDTVIHGEMVLRSEMRANPPHILLTNYSMLEYLLLRPDDNPLFEKSRACWKFIVLDEAHQYRGTQGMEMGMLLRRLKQRLMEGERTEPFRCIATSATLIGGKSGQKTVADFATNLFGEKFFEEDVVLEEIEPIHQKDKYELSLHDYDILKSGQNNITLASRRELDQLASKNGFTVQPDEKVASVIGRILYYDRRTILLRNLITPQETTESSQWTMPQVEEVAQKVFPDLSGDQSLTALSDLIHLLLHAQDPTTQYDAPLMSARYHLFLRSLEGAYVSYGPRNNGTPSWNQKRVYLNRKDDSREYATFEVALCRECGQHYFVGKIDNVTGKFVEAIRDPSNPDFGATYLRPMENDSEEVENEEEDNSKLKKLFLCLVCGEVRERALTCSHNNFIKVVKELEPSDEDRKDQIKECGFCGYNASGRDPVREVVYGTDGPHAVIATTLFQNLPLERKKVLAFADGRQEAAFFAWYLEDTYKDILNRNLILKVIRSFKNYPEEGFSLTTLADRMYRDFGDAFKEKGSEDPPKIKRNIWRSLYRELLTEERRISLEGVGLVRWSVKLPKFPPLQEIFNKSLWTLEDKEIQNVLFILLNSIRLARGVELAVEEDVSLKWDELNLQATQLSFRIGTPSKNVRSWDGATQRGHITRNPRIAFLTKILVKKGIPEDKANKEAAATLRAVWECLIQSDLTNDKLLQPVQGDARRLNPNWWRMHIVSENDIVSQCNTCERIQSVSVVDICSNHRCSGSLIEKQLKELKPNHYRDLYRENLPSNLRVEEHTAQLKPEKAREFQKDFRDGKIHVLSCSTTFELGVDLGGLDTVFLRNIPPEAFNYVQRIGRAGRRRDFPGFAIAYCRKNPHDLFHFSEPQRMLSGHVKPPVLALRNEKIILRHITALALSKFLRINPERYRLPGDSHSRIERLMVDLENPTALIDFKNFLVTHKAELEESIRACLRLIDQEILVQIGITNAEWIDRIAGDDSRLAYAQAMISSDYKSVKKLKADLISEGSRESLQKAIWADDRAKTISDDEAISFLSRMAIIPKYGFPVDVVELDTQSIRLRDGNEISLQRDLSIAVAEFAPSSKLIANKKVWTSYGLKRVAGKEWDRWWYGRCKLHNQFLRARSQKEILDQKCCKDINVSEYVDPQFGFVTNLDKPKKPTGRSSRVFTTRPYFAGFKTKGEERQVPGIVTLSTVSPGFMVVLCEGRRSEGFYVCGECGAGFKNWNECKDGHDTPFGKKCSVQVKSLRPAVSLGHEFITDAIQLQFHPSPIHNDNLLWFAYSLSYALLEGAAEVLEIPSNNLNATVSSGSQNNAIPPIILYDNVPGGAGLVAQLEDFDTLKDCLQLALDRVTNCTGCTENSSCYSCLRSYRNQFAHPHLQRGPVRTYLNVILNQW